MKSSNIPIITAIGHEQDKDDKLLITNVSDLNFHTPSTAAIEINKIMFLPIINNLNSILELNNAKFDELLEKELTSHFNILESLLSSFLKDKFGGQIVNIDSDEVFIIIKKSNKFYKNVITFNNELDFTELEIELRDNLINLVQSQDSINDIQKLFNKLNTNNSKFANEVLEYIKKIKQLSKLENKFTKVVGKKNKKFYLSSFKCNSDFKNLTNIKEIILWYIKILDETSNGINHMEVSDIFRYVSEFT